MRVIYIAGASHSGSTLLDLMLNAHPEIVSVGELANLRSQLEYRNSVKRKYVRCSCGAASIWQCDFWSRVNKQTQKTEGKTLADLDVSDYRLVDEKQAPNAVLFGAISEISGKQLIVDSSKIPDRLSYLLKAKDLNVYPIHLIRNPKGQISSMIRKHGGFLRHIIRYELIHEQIRRKLKDVPHVVVHYEELVLRPADTLNRVLEPLGLQFDPRQLLWAEQVKHNLSGNRMRRQQTSQLVLDEKWKRSLSAIQKLAIDIGTLNSRRAFGQGFKLT